MASLNDQAFVSRLCDQVEDSSTEVSPIEGYELAPLVALERAVVPLELIVPELQHKVSNVVHNCKASIDNLSLDGYRSIALYTQSWAPSEESFYQFLNLALRSKDSKILRPWFMYLRLYITALSKLPSEQQFLYRGVKKDLVKEYWQGKKFFWWQFTSCTTSIDVLAQDLFLGKTGERTIFTINSFTGKSISKYSSISNENEVLLLPGCQFQVESILDAGHELHIIQLKETEPHPSLASVFNQNGTSVLPKKVSSFASHTNPILEKSIEKCQSRKLDLTGEQLSFQDVFIVSQKGIVGMHLKSLNLTCTGMTSDGMSILSDAIRDNRFLEEINISQNSISDLGVEYLSSVISSSALKYINLSENEISDQGVTYLAEVLETNTKLIELSLNENQISNSGVKILADALTRESSALKKLSLNWNSHIDDDSIRTFIYMIKQCQALKKLDLRNCQFSDDGERELYTIAKSRKDLTVWFTKIF